MTVADELPREPFEVRGRVVLETNDRSVTYVIVTVTRGTGQRKLCLARAWLGNPGAWTEDELLFATEEPHALIGAIVMAMST